MSITTQYCKFGNFRENFIFANNVKRHICDVKNREQGKIYQYFISEQQSDIANSRGFDFHETSHMRSFAKIKLLRKFPNLQYFSEAGPRQSFVLLTLQIAIYVLGIFKYFANECI